MSQSLALGENGARSALHASVELEDTVLVGARAGVLVVDDDPDMRELLEASLEARGHAVVMRSTAQEALSVLERGETAVMLTDINMEGMSGIELCRAAVGKQPDLLVVMMTGFGSLAHAVSAMRAGAYDFVTKPFEWDAFGMVLDRAMRHSAMSQELKHLRRRVATEQLPNVIGSSPCMTRMAEMVAQVAEGNTNVVITGESGTGKELVARALHERSGRQGPFLALNCAAVPENLLESELFGHARGAFTDARSAHTGLFVEANHGTLFLDEIAEMPISMQAKILRALQERTVRPVGATQEIPFDARIVTATNRNLEQEVEAKRFREDLYYRINVVRIDVPPLRDRGHDVLLLAQHFLQRAAARSGKGVVRIGRQVAGQLCSYEWPGNVRELENCMERAVALARFDEVTLEELPPKIRDIQATEVASPGAEPDDLPTMELVEERHIRRVLASVSGNKALAARVLGFDRRTLYRKLARYD